MPISIDAAAMEARFANKTGAPAQPAPMQDLSGLRTNQMPIGNPVPEGVVIQQIVGRGQPSMAVVPPKQSDAGAPSMAVVPPSGSNRTTIGTFVEQPISQTRSNPLADTPAQTNSGTANEPVLQTAPPRKKLDLTQAILDHIYELGGDKGEAAQAFYERSQQTLLNWCRNPAVIPMGAITKFLNKAPEVELDIIETLEPDFSYNGNGGVTSLPNRGKLDVMVLSPILERPTLPWSALMVHLAKKNELGYSWQADTMIDRSRNMLADRFLKSGCSWSFWVDGDMGAPTGNADYFRWLTASETINNEAASYDALDRLMTHRKAIVGGVYASRRFHGALVCQPEIYPRNHEDKLLANQIRRGQAQGLADVDWIGFGVALIHKEVFHEIRRKFPQLAPKFELDVWDFFGTRAAWARTKLFVSGRKPAGSRSISIVR